MKPDIQPCADLSQRDKLLREASRLRAVHQPHEALALLAQLEALHPNFSRLHQERGHCNVMLGNAPAAIDALRQAVQLNPTLPSSWDMLERLYRMAGDTQAATYAGHHLAILRQLPQPVVVANSLFADGDLDAAEAVIRDYLDTDSGNVGALRLLARLCRDRHAPDEAEILLRKLLSLAPDYHEARFDYAEILLQQQKHRQARKQINQLLTHEPGNRDYLKQYVAAAIGLGDHEPVIGLCARLVATHADTGQEAADLHLWRANALKITGRAQEAIAAYHAALTAYPDYAVAWFSLANLKTYRFSDTEIAQMRTAQTRPDLAEADRIYLCFALGKALEDRADHTASWDCYAQGNAIRRSTSRYRPAAMEAGALRLRQTFTQEFFAARTGWGADDAAPIFIVGLPRSGSTLVEQMLASHSRIEGTQELTEIGRYTREYCGADPDCGLPLSPEALERLTPAEARARARERFLEETAIYRRLGRPYFIDKMPNNFWHIGLIQLILPQSTIIDVRRDPMGCCFSNLKQLFGSTNQEFTYSIDDVARYYRAYLDMMEHWDAVLPGRVLSVHYEDLIDNAEGATRAMMAHIGVAFEPGCLAFHENDRSVRTPSSEQVRQPINRDGIAQWQNYAPWLAPLREQLGDALARYRH